MKKTLAVFALALICKNISAQNHFGCISHEMYVKQMETNPEFRKNQEQLEKETQEFIKNRATNKTTSASYIIPIVFHIIHTGGSGNISDAQVIDQVSILNEEFNRQQPDTVLTPFAFLPAAAKFNVEFRLATKDPNGKCTNGITRHYSTLSNCSIGEDDVKALEIWPSNRYLNIWIVQSMHYSSSTDCVGGGYATFPGGSANLDGVNIRGDLISNIGTAATNTGWGNFKGRYLIHELGHWFNLRHIWGDANCGNDQVSDTPPALTSNSGCPSFPHNPSNACSGSSPNGEMFTNYMDYTNGPCLNMFTAGQVVRMTAALNSPTSGKNNLWTPANLASTGTSDPYTYPSACAAASPEVLTYTPVIACVGDSIKMTDNSYGGNSTSRLWNFPAGTTSSNTDSIVYVKYGTPGIYSFNLTKNYLGSSNTATFTNRIYILDNNANPAYVVPFRDSLEDASNFVNEWTIVDEGGDGNTWELTNNTSYSGQSCVTLNNYGGIGPVTDHLVSPAYDLTAVTNATLSFRLHFARVATYNDDKMEIFISKNCGKTWSSIYSKANNLRTIVPFQTAAYTPVPGSNEWREEKVAVPNNVASGIVRFRFSFTSGGGNNIFIDDINIGGLNYTGIQNYSLQRGISLSPNPGNASVNLAFNVTGTAPVQVEVIDLMGRTCQESTVEVNEGENNQSINTSSLKDGVYLIRLKQNGEVMYNSKFIKQSAE